ncbi:hypothetical protein AB0I84_36630 [Streptomyces spectabilis]|uniref:hypothetical protein n=1 Tax=Streptomyces spectabilis TaxID=68270 RepID=UPI0033C98B8E
MSNAEPSRTNSPVPLLELRCGGLHLTIQRIPGWLVAVVTTAGGAAGTWWAQR